MEFKIIQLLTLFILTLLVLLQEASSYGEDRETHHLKPRDSLIDVFDQKFHIFCRVAEKKKLINYFKSAKLRIISSAEDIKIVKGDNSDDVFEKYHRSTRWILWAQNLLPWRVRETTFPTFNSSCVGIATEKPYSAMLIIRNVDFWNVVTLVGGIALFFLSPNLARSTFFFYSSGTFFGAAAFALICLFIIYRFMPKSKAAYFTLTSLWFLTLYLAGETWARFEEFLHEKLPYFLVYLTIGAIIAFITCYRIGPPSHPKTLNIITWALQGGSLALIHLSSDLVEVSTGIIVIVVTYYYFSNWILNFFTKIWTRLFPPEIKLLSEEEYIAQGAVETQRSLEELRKFCSSPQCKSWNLVLKLKNPRRFSSFIQGESHLSDEELMDYESGDAENPHLSLSDSSSNSELEIEHHYSPNTTTTTNTHITRNNTNNTSNTTRENGSFLSPSTSTAHRTSFSVNTNSKRKSGGRLSLVSSPTTSSNGTNRTSRNSTSNMNMTNGTSSKRNNGRVLTRSSVSPMPSTSSAPLLTDESDSSD